MLLTIGHSNHSAQRFNDLLRQHGVTALCDVRSRPYSRMQPQFNREALTQSLRESGIKYVFLGKELGARREDPACYENGRVSYELVAETALFQFGLDRVQSGMDRHRIALMCADKDPITCHRTILVARHLRTRGIDINHILADGSIETHDEALARLRRSLSLEAIDLFRSEAEVLEDAYALQGARIAYAPEEEEAAVAARAD
ncbi:MAG: DUF488 domain-containing protein [Acidobacteria bacterium]|nr:DUF488 domain-containing protein [Acidobacteriota bacterium]